MRRYVLRSSGEGFRPVAEDAPAPAAGRGDVVVRVRACALNFRDLIIARGQSGLKNLDGLVPLSDGAGEVEAVGEDVTGFRPGDRVVNIFFRDWVGGPFDLRYHETALGGALAGMLAERVVLPAHALALVPAHLSLEQAACLPCAGVTAWRGLVTRGGLRAGQTVLCLGTGGVSIFGLQIAQAFGARVIITSSSDAKLERARRLGAWATVNYREVDDWEREVWRLTDKRGVDHVLEVGGPGTLERSIRCAAPEAHVALIGVLTGFGPPQGSLFPLVSRNATMDGIYVGSRADLIALSDEFAKHTVAPVVDRVFDFAAVPEAYEYLGSGAHFGKVVVRLP